MIPVVIIHMNNAPYLNPVISQAIRKNEVYFISNIYAQNSPHLNCLNISDFYSDNIQIFSDCYDHLHNSSSRVYELFCYQRWFLLLEFMKKFQLEVVMHIDSDVLLLVNAEDEWKNFDQYIMTLSYGCSGATSYITIDGLSKFTEMLINIYKNKSYYFDLLSSRFSVMQNHRRVGGICDMTLLELFKNSSDFGGYGRVGEMMHIINESTYDHNINCEDQDFAMVDSIKKLEYENGNVYVYNNRLRKKIKFNSLHCQGNAKQHIDTIYKNICNI